MKEKDYLRISEDCMRVKEQILVYPTNYLNQYKKHVKMSNTTLYGSSSNINRGYFCPSLILDIIVGNAKRGRLIQNRTPKSATKIEYIFYLDNENRLSAIEHIPNEYEIIFYPNHKISQGILFTENSKRILFTETQICGEQIQSFIQSEYDREAKMITDYYGEFYNYTAQRFSSVDVFRMQTSFSGFEHVKYIFQRDEEGWLKTYRIENFFDNGEIDHNYIWNEHIWNVPSKIKRK